MSLVAAEAFDTWRVMPRIMLLAYAILVSNLYLWYKSIPTYVQEQCDAATLQIFLNNKIPIEQSIKLSCTVKDVVGGPTPAQTTLVTTIMGLTSVVFGFYTASGRRWDTGLPGDIGEDPILPRRPGRGSHGRQYGQYHGGGPPYNNGSLPYGEQQYRPPLTTPSEPETVSEVT